MCVFVKSKKEKRVLLTLTCPPWVLRKWPESRDHWWAVWVSCQTYCPTQCICLEDKLIKKGEIQFRSMVSPNLNLNEWLDRFDETVQDSHFFYFIIYEIQFYFSKNKSLFLLHVCFQIQESRRRLKVNSKRELTWPQTPKTEWTCKYPSPKGVVCSLFIYVLFLVFFV